MYKLEIFEDYLNLITVEKIRDFTKFAILNLPEYFWTAPASSSGKYHGGESLLHHVLSMLFVGKNVVESQMKDYWTERQKSQYISAIILHDGWKFGVEETLPLKTDPNHADIGYKQILRLVMEFNKNRLEEKKDIIGAKDYSTIARAVRYHYGPFLYIKDNPFCWDWTAGSVIIQVHMLDYHNTYNSLCHNVLNDETLRIRREDGGIWLFLSNKEKMFIPQLGDDFVEQMFGSYKNNSEIRRSRNVDGREVEIILNYLGNKVVLEIDKYGWFRRMSFKKCVEW